jgi:Golgi SNAP receptor complex protein 2
MARDEFALREQSFARNTDSQLDDFIGQAQNLLENLTDQHSILKVHGALTWIKFILLM